MKEVDRRQMLKSFFGIGAAGAGILVASRARAGQEMADLVRASCGLKTPEQTEGPFYPVKEQADVDTDLTRVQGRAGTARGEVVLIQGQVTDRDCKPVAGALVEIWQACESGRYNHPADPNTAPLDPDFQYWGRSVTDSDGKYGFRTIIPGAYPAGDGWIRPPHVHFKVHKLGYHELTTQMYFAGQKLNDNDLILKAVPASQRDRVVVQVRRDQAGDPGVCSFDLTLERVV